MKRPNDVKRTETALVEESRRSRVISFDSQPGRMKLANGNPFDRGAAENSPIEPLLAFQERPTGLSASMPAPSSVRALHFVAAMRGGCESKLMLGSDHKLWIVKFQNNPQHKRVLVNEMIGSLLARSLGLSIPIPAVVQVDDWLIEKNPPLRVHRGHCDADRWTSRLHFGSRFAGSRMPMGVMDCLPASLIGDLKNSSEFHGMLAFDKWVGNCDRRQAVFARASRRRRYRAVFVDHGYCFNAEKWSFPDHPLSGTFAQREVYAGVTGWNSFEPWLSQIEQYPEDSLWRAFAHVPPAWFDEEYNLVERLIESLRQRRTKVRELIGQFRDSDRAPFPNWEGSRTHLVTVPRFQLMPTTALPNPEALLPTLPNVA